MSLSSFTDNNRLLIPAPRQDGISLTYVVFFYMQVVQTKQANRDKHALQPTTSVNVPRPKAIEDIYQKKSQLEHILLRPDTYIGSTEKKEDRLWVHNGEQLVQQDITYAPGLYKIFDEILVNAADNKVRDCKMDTLKVDISAVRLPDSMFCYSSSAFQVTLHHVLMFCLGVRRTTASLSGTMAMESL